MILLWTTAIFPLRLTWGWELTSLGAPWVAQTMLLHVRAAAYFGDGWITQSLERAISTGEDPVVFRQEISQLFHRQFLLILVWVSPLKVHGERLVVAGQQVGQFLKECLFHGQFLHFLVI